MKRIRINLFGIFVAIILSSTVDSNAQNQTRTFTSKDGKTMQAKMVSANETEAIVVRSDGRSIRFPLTLLSAEDQAYVQKWAKENVIYTFRFRAGKKIKDSDVTTKDYVRTTIRTYVYDIEIENAGRTDIEDLSVRFRAYVDDGFIEGSHTIRTLEEKRSEKFESVETTIKEVKTKPDPNQVRNNNNNNDYRTKVEKTGSRYMGIWIKVYKDGKMIAEHKSADSAVKRAVW